MAFTIAGYVLDYTLVPIGALTFLIYHIFLVVRIRRTPLQTVIGYNHYTRAAWVSCVMNEKRDILAVQTLRNSVMGATLLATAAVAISAGLGTILASSTIRGNNSVFSSLDFYTLSKLFVLTASFLLAFLSCIQSIRYLNHAAYLINIPSSYSPLVTHSHVCTVIEKGMNFYTVSIRFFYFSFTLVMWLFGAIPYCCATLILVAILFFLDRNEQPKRTEV